MPEICVVYLIRESNGIEPVQRFLDSYRLNPGGIDHDLVVIFKGFSAEEAGHEYIHLLNAFYYQSITVADEGFDIQPYFTAVKRFNTRYFCFLNSFSTLLDPKWLFKLYAHIKEDNVGIVGSTGSYESMYSDVLAAHSKLKDMELWSALLSKYEEIKYKIFFNPFPNYHIRTNGFIISRDVMNSIKCGSIRSKMAAHRFESGKNSLTNQILRRGIKALVVGRDGKAYEKEDWAHSGTFRQGEQSNLLIADNQTNAYLNGTQELRRELARLAWGK